MIRMARKADGADLIRLFSALGYDQGGRDLAAALAAPAPERQVLVHESDGRVDGVLVLHLLIPLHREFGWGLISALVVDETRRSAGIGAALLAGAEAYCRAAGCSQIEVSSSEPRRDAHRFYQREGYQERRKRLVKVLL